MVYNKDDMEQQFRDLSHGAMMNRNDANRKSSTACREADAVDEVLRAIRRILRRTTEVSRQLSRVSGLSVAGMLCLRAIGEMEHRDEVTVVGVSRAVQLAPATVSRILDRLEAAGLIERQRSSTDRRRVCLRLTNVGRVKLRELPRPLQEQFVARLKALSSDEQMQICATLQQVVAMMEADRIDASPLLSPEASFDEDAS